VFVSELMPVLKELSQQPIAFLGGFFSGMFRLNLADDPVKSWLDKQAGISYPVSTGSPNGKGNSPQSITIE
jgi:hypothetical protein